jgi:hypothetical protein
MIKINEIQYLRKQKPEHAISIYIPTEITGDYQKNRILWKNACQRGLKKLKTKTKNAEEIMAPAFELAKDSKFWAYQTNGLAVFISKNIFKIHHLSRTVPEFVHVHDHFYLNPLLEEVSKNIRIFVLAISQKKVDFFEAVEDGIFPVFIEDLVVKNMQEALNIDEYNNSLQFRSIGGGKSLFHGSGIEDNTSDDHLKEYFRRIDQGIMQIIHDEKVPMVLAAVEEYHQVYKSITKYQHFSNHFIPGNPSDLSPKEIRKNVQPVFDELYENEKVGFHQSFQNKKTAGLTSDNLEDILFMARNNNVDILAISMLTRNKLWKENPDKLEELMFLIYDQAGTILIDKNLGKGIKAILRFDMQTTL